MDERLKKSWSTILGLDETEINDDLNFFEAGGDSVSAIKLTATAADLGLEIHAQQLFENPTFGELKEVLKNSEDDKDSKTNGQPTSTAKAQKTTTRSDIQSYRMINELLAQCNVDGALLEDVLPCGPFQRELMRASNNLGCWTFQAVYQVSENGVGHIKQVIDQLHKDNPVFRARIAQHDTELYQLVFKDTPKWNEVTEPLEAYKQKDMLNRMSYGAPLSRCTVIRDGDSIYVLWTQTHAIYDRWSKMHVLNDMQSAFTDLKAFRSNPQREPYCSYVNMVESSDAEQGAQYWKDQLEGYTNYQQLWKAAANQEYKTMQEMRRTMPYLRPDDKQITFATAAQVAWSLVLANEVESDDIFYCTFRSCRQMNLKGIDGIVGPLWTLCPLRCRLTPNTTLDDLLRREHKKMVGGIRHEPFGIKAMNEHFGHQGYTQSVLLVQPPQPDSFGKKVHATDDTTSQQMWMQSRDDLWVQTRSHFGFYIMLTPKGKDLELWARFDDRFIDSERVAKFLTQFSKMIERVMKSNWNETKLSDLVESFTSASKDDSQLTNGVVHETEEYELEGVDNEAPKTLTHLLNKTDENAVACVVPGKPQFKITYKDLETHIKSFQQSLADIGIKHESAVSMPLGNTYELVVAFQAVTRQRAIAAPLNPSYKQDEFEFYIEDLGSSLVLIPKDTFNDKNPAVKAARKHKAAVAEVSYDAKSNKINLDIKERGKLGNDSKSEILTAEQDDVALVLHTSGTTGRPKAVPLTHLNLVTNITNICNTYHLTTKDRTLLIMPLFHVHGLLASFLSPLRSGGAAIIPARLTPEFWSIFRDNNATWYSATPTMHRMILNFPCPDDLDKKKIRFIRSCSSQLPEALFKQLEDKFSAPVLESYAMTEACHLMFSNPLPVNGQHKAGSVGLPQFIETQILDEEGKEVEKGGVGEVHVKGPNVTKGYINNEEANDSSFTEDGFFGTGDQGKFDNDGYLVLTGRLKELINKGGEKISPVELDNVISQREDVAECVCFAVDDEDYGQEVGVAIKMHEGKKLDVKEFKKWVGGKVAAHKVPKKIWFPDEIPKTATGKVQRKSVAEKMMESKPAE